MSGTALPDANSRLAGPADRPKGAPVNADRPLPRRSLSLGGTAGSAKGAR
jgi:hypothetical protein